MKMHCIISVLAVGAMLLTGCSSKDEVQRYHLSGKVTYKGAPVPVGMISFEPVEPGIGGGFAPIINGEFDTSDGGRGHLGGMNSVRISGFDGIENPADPDAPPNALFPSFETTVTLPDSTDEMDFTLPMDASKAS